MPVFPLVASRIVLPGVSRPRAMPSRIIASPGRSLTLPPGLSISALPDTVTPSGSPAVTAVSRTSGVLPTRSRRVTSRCLVAAVAISYPSAFDPLNTGRAKLEQVDQQPGTCGNARPLAIFPRIVGRGLWGVGRGAWAVGRAALGVGRARHGRALAHRCRPSPFGPRPTAHAPRPTPLIALSGQTS